MLRVGKLLVPVVLVCALIAPGMAQEQAANSPAPSPCPPQTAPTVVAAAGPAPVSHVNPAPPRMSNAAAAKLTPGQKFDVFVHSTYSPYTAVTTLFNAGMAQAQGDWYSYGGGMEGYGKRVGASLANTESGVFFGTFLYPTLFHQDPRYFAERHGSTMHRVGYAASRVLITKNDFGTKTFNSSHVLASFTASALANSYYPREDRGFGDTMTRAGGTLLNDAITNVLREFWPDIRRKLIRHEPKSIKRLEESPTVARIEQMMTPPLPPACPLPQDEAASKPSTPDSETTPRPQK
jgi:hypothetical protein